MATKTAEAEEQVETPAETHDGPVLDMSDAAVKKLIKTAKARGFVTYDELNEVLPSEEVSSEQIEDTMAMLSDMGINVVDSDEAEEAENAADGPEGKAIAAPTPIAKAETTTKEPTDRTDDPVRMYLREMGTVELLSREGEIAIAPARSTPWAAKGCSPGGATRATAATSSSSAPLPGRLPWRSSAT